ncbi:Uncharacterised protein [Priestia megaterium]|nr:Uncharacterised protein [Priestia megaterium]
MSERKNQKSLEDMSIKELQKELTEVLKKNPPLNARVQV